MTPEEVESLFTHPEGYRFARWGRPIAPVVFGLADDSLQLAKGAIEAVVVAANHKMAEQDAELGANLIMFFFRDWSELEQVPTLGRLVTDPPAFIRRHKAAGATVARIFRFDEQGAIKQSVLFLRIDKRLQDASASVLMLDQAARSMLTFNPESVLMADGAVRGEIAGVLRAAYDPVMPPSSIDPSHALRIAARL